MSNIDTLPRLLIVDDLPANLHAMQRMLRGLAVEIDEALGGESAVELLLKNEYAVVLLDVQMPDMSGYEVAEMMANFEATKYTPIVFVTANAAEEVAAQRGYNAGAIDYIFKPLNKMMLISKLTVLLQLYEQRKKTERANVELKHSLIEVKAANATRDVFLDNMSHEIRTPLNGIVGATDLLGKTQLDVSQRYYNQIVQNSSETLQYLIGDILDYSKLESSKVELEPHFVDLGGLLQNVVQAVNKRAIANNVELFTRFSGAFPRLVVDPSKLTQLLVHLMANAVKFSKDSYVVLEIETLSRSETALKLAFKVEDGGIGISEESLESIFDRFVQQDGTTTKRYSGTGLGLAICKKISDLMGGELRVTSRLGEGSQFRFEVELELSKDVDSAVSTFGDQPLSGQRVLVVDSSPMGSKIVQENIGAWGAKIQVVPGSALALDELVAERAAGNPYGALVIDVASIAGEDAVELVRKVHSATGDTRPKIIIQSSAKHSVASAFSTSTELIDGHLMKPIGPLVLLNQLQDLLAGRESESISELSENAERDAADDQLSGPDLPRERRILVVDDSPVNQVCTEAMLSTTGCEVVLAENGKEALDKYSSHDFDLIFMDCMMPVMDGYEATRRIRELSSSKRRIPIIAMTANALVGDKEKCLQAGMDAYLSKPIRQNVLIEAMEVYLAA